ncbi:hypothetical protein JOF41_005142 [Saccharothrix coeruleofusca]|nr:hypothetical protein [Saccharothrix coeruleofusca]
MKRDPFIDAVRAIAVVGVVLGHWLVTAPVLTGGGIAVDSPLRWMPGLAPVSWLFQTLGLFFFTGGFAAARAGRFAPRRLVRPVALLLGAWAVVLLGLSARGLPQQTVLTVATLVVSPLWFLGVYVVLRVCTPLFERLGWWGVPLPVALVALDVGWLNVAAVWWAPWQLGVVAARHGYRRAWGAVLLVLGAVAFALLLSAGYPVSAVGVPGAAESNLFPPSPAALALALAQIGLVVLVRPGFRARWVNDRALPIFLLHQSALLVVVLAGAAVGPLPGLHTPPDDPLWVLQRLAWLPVLGGVALALVGYRRQQRQADGGAVQRDHRGGRLDHQQRRHAGQRGQQPGAAAVAGARPGGVQQVPAQQQVDEVLQRVDLEHHQGARVAGEPGDHEPEHAEGAVADAEGGGQPGAVGLPGAAGEQPGVPLEPVERQQ